jgi:esterase/lipase superfamily enzyme
MERLSVKLFIEQLRDAMAYEDASTLKQAFVFIHGYNVSFEDAAFRTAQIVHDMEFNGAPIFYSWPSRGQVEDYPYDKESNRQARNHLGKFLRLVREESGGDVIHLIAHSMGNDALLEALRDLNHRDDRTKPLFGEVVLAAPDVAFDDFLDRAEDIEGVARGYTLMRRGMNSLALQVQQNLGPTVASCSRARQSCALMLGSARNGNNRRSSRNQ